MPKHLEISLSFLYFFFCSSALACSILSFSIFSQAKSGKVYPSSRRTKDDAMLQSRWQDRRVELSEGLSLPTAYIWTGQDHEWDPKVKNYDLDLLFFLGWPIRSIRDIWLKNQSKEGKERLVQERMPLAQLSIFDQEIGMKEKSRPIKRGSILALNRSFEAVSSPTAPWAFTLWVFFSWKEETLMSFFSHQIERTRVTGLKIQELATEDSLEKEWKTCLSPYPLPSRKKRKKIERKNAFDRYDE